MALLTRSYKGLAKYPATGYLASRVNKSMNKLDMNSEYRPDSCQDVCHAAFD